MQRIEAFLGEDEVPTWATSLESDRSGGINHASGSNSIGFENATFQWNSRKSVDVDSSSAHFTLKDLSIFFPIGQLTIIAGPTGSGKTALLHALLGGKYAFFVPQ